ncbi:MAG: endonuclease/exonuclease/phosphatase family protein [Rhizobiaceae bacterium]|nr:endonuclease/exonuclease/phosphatase family protein [Rhizobiaceae bacterium]
MIRLVKNLIILCVSGSVIVVGAGFLGKVHPAFDTLSHFRMHFSLCLLIAFLVLAFTRHRFVASCALIAAIVGIYKSQTGYPWSAEQKMKIMEKPEYSLLHLNLLWNHDDPAPVVEWLDKQNADILSLSELSHVWEPHIVGLHRKWPFIFHCPEYGKRGGVRIYSKWPMRSDHDYCGVYGTLGITSVVAPSGETLEVASLHLRWPWPASGPAQLETFVPKLKNLSDDFLIAGDFNATPWSNTVQRFATLGNLKTVLGIGPSWLFRELPSWLTRFIGLPIDHIMHKGRVHVLSAERMEHVGSDHFPILVRFQISD